MNKNNINTEHFEDVQNIFSEKLVVNNSFNNINHFETVQKVFEKKLNAETIKMNAIGDVNGNFTNILPPFSLFTFH